MKKRSEILKEYEAERPRPWVLHLLLFVCHIINRLRPAEYKFLFDKKRLKNRQVLVLSIHAAYDDSIYVPQGIGYIGPNAIMGRHHIYKTFLFRLLLAGGVIPKPLFISDFNTARSMMRLKKKGASFLLFPEGIQSTDGTQSPLHPATVKLIRMLKMETVLCTSHGAYLSNPRFDTGRRKGHMEYRFEILFSEDEIGRLTEDEIKARLYDRFYLNDFAWNAKHQYKYRGKAPNATGLTNILFICPKCRRQFAMKVDGESIVCECGSRVKVDECYNLIPSDLSFPFKRIDLWYQWQREVVEKEVSEDGFKIEYRVEHLTLNDSRFDFKTYIKLGEGTVTLDHEGLVYRGNDGGRDVSLSFDIRKIPSASIIPGKGNQLYYDDRYDRFIMKDNGTLSTKVMLAVEIMHNRHDEAWRKSYEDMAAIKARMKGE